MSSLDYLIIALASAFSALIELEIYSKLVNDKLFKIDIKSIIITFVIGILITINTYSNTGYSKPIINFMLMIISSSLYFNNNISKTILYTLYCFLIMIVYEILLSSFVLFYFEDINKFDSNVALKVIFTLFSVGLTLVTCYLKPIKNIAHNYLSKILNKKVIIIIASISLLILYIIDVNYSLQLNKEIYFVNAIIVIGVFLLLIINVYNYYKINKEIQKTEILLNFMSKYERIIDDNRINRHEMLNNLLALKSIKDKNSKEYNDVLDELIVNYSKNNIDFKNAYYLPTGIKGIFYYKLNGLDEKGYNIKINVFKQISNSFKDLPRKEYLNLYKIIGILLDNAIEASAKSKDKIINIDVYKENGKKIIIIDNSFKGKIELNKINNKNYSTKGKGRGLGLYIIKNILNNNDYIKLEQSIYNHIFSSKIIIK